MVCFIKMRDGKPCGREIFKTDDKCVFHSFISNKNEEFLKSLNDYLKEVEQDGRLSDYDFSGFFFLHPVSFEQMIFSKPVYCFKARFDGGVNFFGTKFQDYVDFSKSTVGNVNFSECVFERTAIFSEVAFRGGVDFSNTEFKEKADFSQTGFTGYTADFERAKFYGEVNFKEAHFEPVCLFGEVIFLDKAEFVKARFNKTASFAHATFRSRGFFAGAKFEQEANFGWTVFEGEVSFFGVNFAQKAFFIGDNNSHCFKKECDFRLLFLSGDAKVVFEKTNLSKTRFLDTNLEGINFRDVEWCKEGKRKSALWDEFRPIEEGEEKERNYEKIAENYRQLVLNYESKRDFDTAEDFHVGEMEMRRKKRGPGVKWPWLRWLREQLNTYNFYRILSNYGTSYVQALIVLGIFIMFFSAIFFSVGFRPVSEGVPELNFGRAILLTLSVVTFQRERFYEPIDDWGRFWLYFSVFVLTAQVALLLLAIRRRFKR